MTNTDKPSPPLAAIDLLVLDVDGVLTDGSLLYDDRGREIKRFHVRDGLGIKLARDAGIRVAVLSSRSSPAVTLRMRELKVTRVVQGVADKRAGLERLLTDLGARGETAAYVGDDLQDLPAMRCCAYRMAVADAAAEVREAADYVTRASGGRGAVREAVEHLLKAQGKWDAAVRGLISDF